MTCITDKCASHKPAWGVLVAIFLVNLVCHLPFLGSSPISGTEGLRSLPAHAMVQSGDWLVPMLYGRVYLRKPPLHYWCIAISEKIFGAGEWAWRLPSVIQAAALATVLAFFTWRWFGRRAGIVAGLLPMILVFLWGNARCADIDMLNTLVSVSGAFCMLELYFREPRKPWLWALLAGLLLGASAMTKGPAGLPVFGGVWVFAAVCAIRQRKWRWFGQGGTWMPWLMGLAIFAAYGLAAYCQLTSHGHVVDWEGLREGQSNMAPRDWGTVLWAALLIPTLLAYGAPATLTLFSTFVRGVRVNAGDPLHEPTIRALRGAVVTAWALCLVSGMTNPRYGYVTMPLVVPLAGAMVAAFGRLTLRQQWWFAAWPVGTAVALAGAQVVTSWRAWEEPQWHGLLLGLGLAGGVLCLGVVLGVGVWRRWGWSWAIIGQAMLLSIPFAIQLNQEHWQKSGYSVAKQVREIVGNDKVYAGEAIFDQPDIFYYSGVNGYTTAEVLPPPQKVAGGQWILLKDSGTASSEFEVWGIRSGRTPLTRVVLFHRPNKNADEYALGWLSR